MPISAKGPPPMHPTNPFLTTALVSLELQTGILKSWKEEKVLKGGQRKVWKFSFLRQERRLLKGRNESKFEGLWLALYKS